MVLLLLAGAVLLAACGSMQSQQINAVTPLPAQDATVQTEPDGSVEATHTAVPAPTPAPNTTTTPTPLNIQLPLGSAAAIAAATDAVMGPTPRAPITFDKFPVALKFDEFYDGYNLRTGLVLSDKLASLDGQRVVMEGYMAPPLKPELDFFVLTRVRLAFCPFCSTAAEWPDDIALIYLTNGTMVTTAAPLRLTGRLELGPLVDPETGMVSLVRIYADSWETL